MFLCHQIYLSICYMSPISVKKKIFIVFVSLGYAKLSISSPLVLDCLSSDKIKWFPKFWVDLISRQCACCIQNITKACFSCFFFIHSLTLRSLNPLDSKMFSEGLKLVFPISFKPKKMLHTLMVLYVLLQCSLLAGFQM